MALTPRRSGSGLIKPLAFRPGTGAMIGHVEPVLTLPIGLEVDAMLNYLDAGDPWVVV